MSRAFPLALLGLVPLASSIDVATLYTTPTKGQVTYVGAGRSDSSEGHCSLGPANPRGIPKGMTGVTATAGVSSAIYALQPCGMCLQVTDVDTKKVTTVYVNDECTTCAYGDLNLAIDGGAKSNVEWIAVPCDTGAAPINYVFQGSNPYYIKVQPRWTKCPVKSFAVAKDGKWQEGQFSADDFFTFNAGPYNFPLTVKITSIFGEIVTDTLTTMSGTPAPGGNKAQFTTCKDGAAPKGVDPVAPAAPATVTAPKGSTAGDVAVKPPKTTNLPSPPGPGVRGTPGLTPGEPGQGDHGQGMKGLGGGTVEVLCHPDQVAKGEDFTVNVGYTMDIKRPVDVKVDLVNAKTKVGYVGKVVHMENQTGNVSLTLKLPDNAEEPFLWKVMVNPREEPFPNMLAETGFVAHLGPKTVQTCQSFEPTGKDLPPKNVDYVLLTKVGDTVKAGVALPVTIRYNVASTKGGQIVASLMLKGPNQLVASSVAEAPAGVHQVDMEIPVPKDLTGEPVYVVATLTPTGKGWEDRLGEDRTYNIKIGRRRQMLRE